MSKFSHDDLVTCTSCSQRAQVVAQHGVWCSQCGMEPFPKEHPAIRAWRQYHRFVRLNVFLLWMYFSMLVLGVDTEYLLSAMAPEKRALWHYSFIALFVLWVMSFWGLSEVKKPSVAYHARGEKR